VQPLSAASDIGFGGGAYDEWNAEICGSPGIADGVDEGNPASA